MQAARMQGKIWRLTLGRARRAKDDMLSLDETKLERRSLARNEFLFRQGDKVQAIYFIEEGRMRLDRRTFDGRSLVFGTSSAGEFFVEAALFADIFHCDAVATEPVRSLLPSLSATRCPPSISLATSLSPAA
jgi:CRP-like cAMP-binding protein